MWNFTDIWQYGAFTGTLSHLSSTWVYYSWILSSVKPTIDLMYNDVLTNPIFMWLIAVILVLSLFTFSD